MSTLDDSLRVNLILQQLTKPRELSDSEFEVFQVMVSLNEKNFTSLSASELMGKHQKALDYIIENA